MAKRKTNQTDDSVDAFIDSIEDESRREDCRAITRIMRTATGQEPRMWGTSIIGFGKHHYQYANGKPAEICKVGFAPRARSFAFYLPKYPQHRELIPKLGKHKYSGGCLHLTKLADVDVRVLARMVKSAFRTGGRGGA
jgi:Domain of unknown function (DU1801)